MIPLRSTERVYATTAVTGTLIGISILFSGITRLSYALAGKRAALPAPL